VGVEWRIFVPPWGERPVSTTKVTHAGRGPMSRMRHSTKRYGESVTRSGIFCTAGVVECYLRLAVDKKRVDGRHCTRVGNPFLGVG
jgi:hypothetical protein